MAIRTIKFFGIFLLTGLLLALMPVGGAQAATFNVCSSGCDFSTLQAAIAAASAGDTIQVGPGTYTETGQIVINKNLTIIGAGKTLTIIKPAQNTGSVDDARGWFLVNEGVTFNLSNVTLDGNGYDIHTALRTHGSGIISNNRIINVNYVKYVGLGLGILGPDVQVLNNTFENIGRIGVHITQSTTINVLVSGNTYIGKGSVDSLDYAIEVGKGAKATISNNTISNCLAVASSDGSVSAGILVTTFYGAGTEAVITGNTISNSSNGVYIGYNDEDTSKVTISSNTFTNNDVQIINTNPGNTMITIGENSFDRNVTIEGDLINVYGKIQTAIDASVSGDVINVSDGIYEENIIVDKPLTISGESRDGTVIYPARSGIYCNFASLCAESSNVFLIEADDVVINNLTVDGDNPNLTTFDIKDIISPVNMNGKNPDARNGIITNHIKNGNYKNLEVHHVNIRNIYLRGVYMSTNGNFNFHHNDVSNVAGEDASIAMFAWYGPGIFDSNVVSYANDAISANHSKGIQFTNNIVTHSSSGIHTDNAGSGGVGVADEISGNTISDCQAGGYGIFVFAPYNNTWVKENTVTNCSIGLSLWGTYNSSEPVFETNVVTGPDKEDGSVGIYVTTDLIGWGYLDVRGIFKNNQISNFKTALEVTADEMPWEPGAYVEKSAEVTISDNSLSIYDKAVVVGKNGTYSINASGNWWGSEDVAVIEPLIDGRVDFTPWLVSGEDIDNSTAGFQGDFSALRVDDAGSQIGSVGRIQEAIDLVSGSTVYINPGTYPENINVNKSVHIIGSGNGSNPALDSIITSPVSFDFKLGLVNLTASGNSSEDPISLENLRLAPVGQSGINVGRFTGSTGITVKYVKIDRVNVIGTNVSGSTEQERGLYVDNTSTLDSVEIVDSSFNNLHYGFYFQKAVNGVDQSTVSNLSVTNTTFNHNNLKGIYAEKLENSIFTDVVIHENGYDATGLPSYFIPWMAGVDINLKDGDYANISFIRPIITNNALGGAQHGVGITVKARDDGGTYGPYPASLTNVLIEGAQITGNERGVRIGEPGKLNVGPTKVFINFSRIFDNKKTYSGTDGSVYGGIINYSQAEVSAENNWFGCNPGPGGSSRCNRVISVEGFIDAIPWLTLTAETPQDAIDSYASAEVTASLLVNSNGLTPSTTKTVPDTTPVQFSATEGAFNPIDSFTLTGISSSTFTAAGTAASDSLCVKVDNETVCQPVAVNLGTLTLSSFGYAEMPAPANLLGVTVDLNLLEVLPIDAVSIVVKLYGDNDGSKVLLQTNTANMDAGWDAVGHSFSTPFDIFGSFDYESDGYWTNVREAEYGQTIFPTRVEATVVLKNGKVLTAEIDVMDATKDDRTIIIKGTMAAEDFGYMNVSGVFGVSAGFRIDDNTLTGAKSIVMKLYGGENGDVLLQTNTAILGAASKFDGMTQFSSPFDIFGEFDYAADGYWVNTRETEYGRNEIPTRVVATVTLFNGKTLTAENTQLTGDRNSIIVDKPIGEPDSYVVLQGEVLSIAAPGVLENDRDLNNEPLSAILVNDVLSGSLTLNEDGSFEYVPQEGFEGDVTFTYKAYNGRLYSYPVMVTITVVDPTPDVPTSHTIFLPLLIK